MIKPPKLQPGDKVAVVSLSSGVLGEPFAAHELALGEQRLKELGLTLEYMPNARKGIEYIKAHPDARAADLKHAFMDSSIKAIICAIGGDDTYRTIPYLLDDPEFIQAVKDNPKIFLGFSDTTNNHLTLYKLGLQTYYGHAFLTDFAEFAREMLPYTKEWTWELLNPAGSKEIASSPVWYEERESYDESQVGVDRVAHDETRGYEVLRSSGSVEGELLGGCIESLYDQLTGDRYPDEKGIIEKYEVFPSADQWKGKVLFAETSEEKPTPEKLKTMLRALESAGIFANVKAIIVGKPQDETFYEEYKAVWLEATKGCDLPILYNLNFGHAAPRCILPYGGKVKVDFSQAKVFLLEPLVA
jgi:muramoyltetrapeptide carboxypeptidase LdcA involved in peptidoglycan recycling